MSSFSAKNAVNAQNKNWRWESETTGFKTTANLGKTKKVSRCLKSSTGRLKACLGGTIRSNRKKPGLKNIYCWVLPTKNTCIGQWENVMSQNSVCVTAWDTAEKKCMKTAYCYLFWNSASIFFPTTFPFGKKDLVGFRHNIEHNQNI